MLAYQQQSQPAATTFTITPPSSTGHVRGPFCAEACEACTNVILEAMTAGRYGTAPARTITASSSRLLVAARAPARTIAPLTMITRSKARVTSDSAPLQSPFHSRRAPTSTTHAQTTDRVFKPAQRRARSPRTQPPATPQPEASTRRKVTIKLRWSPTLVIPDPKSWDQTIRPGGRKLQLEPKWRAQKIKEWSENRAKFEHEQQDTAGSEAA